MPTGPKRDRVLVPLRVDTDVSRARQVVARKASEAGLGLTARTKFVTAVSEIARNCIIHGGGGQLGAETMIDLGRLKVKVLIEDHGPGIADVDCALTNGYTTGKGLGLGLGGSKRLVQSFRIESVVGDGTRVWLEGWK